MDRIPLYSKRVVQNPETHDFAAQIWAPKQEYKWKKKNFLVEPSKPLLIYETHIGMAQEKEAVGTYKQFEEKVLPRVKEQGYNAIQMMALMQHPYYGSFGYHVSNYFAASSWFGTPDDLKSLIDKAHSMGISVIMVLVQSHAVKNKAEGINEFDGTDYQFFHSGAKGNHTEWDSKLFDYGKHDVIHFLLSNIKFWMEEYHIDGFRFDGVTSMLYHDHGLGTNFDDYVKYFNANMDVDAVVYLQFANELIKEIRKDAITIAEDMSGMPGMALPIKEGGIGFDYRLAMGMPDFWVKTLQSSDEDWDMFKLWHELSTSRPNEKRIGYVESHDQALVGDKTTMFRMADKGMYTHMNKGSQSLVIERAVALHKMIRLITISLGSEGYLNFMGNEFGHPEWIDFPREGNGWSFKHCKRQWSLVDNPFLRYEELINFDKGMLRFMGENSLMGVSPESLWIDQEMKIVAYSKKEFIFIFNFHPVISIENLEIPTHENGNFVVVMDTDEKKYGGFDRISHDVTYKARQLSTNENYTDYTGITIYSPSRTAMVLRKVPPEGGDRRKKESVGVPKQKDRRRSPAESKKDTEKA
jgi:1,4-alpha-glucan branching enzyme